MTQQSPKPAQPHNLPAQPPPLIGREEEAAEITALLADPACRLLTLVGPGGVGKTRLAIETAARLRPDFARGVLFVSLQSIQAPEYLFSAVADGLKLPLSGREKPQTQLLTYLRDKEILLVLDNFQRR